MPKNKAGLNPRQERFVLAYLACLNATQAAIEVGYRERSAKVHASRLLSNANVKAEIERRKQMSLAARAITKEQVISMILGLIERASKLKQSAGAIQAGLKGCELLAKHLGMFGDSKGLKRPLLQDNRLQIAIQRLIPSKSGANRLLVESATDLQPISAENADNVTPASVPQESTDVSVDNKAVTDAPDEGSVCQ